MEQAHSRAIEALQPFVHLAISTNQPTPRFVANLITNATSNPNTYVFAELLETPAVQSLRSPDVPEEHRAYLTLLEIFAWGTWQDYHSTPSLPALSQEQSQKLRLLSLLSLATSANPLTYDKLLTSLELPSASALESFVTTAIYASLISARLSPTTTPPVVHVTAVAPLRDVRPEARSSMVTVLSEWEDRCGEVIRGIEAEIARIRSEAEKNWAKEKDKTDKIEKSVAGWTGDRDLGGDDAGASSGQSLRPKESGGSSNSSAGHARKTQGSGGSTSNKREFNATTDGQEDDDGYFDGSDGAGEPGSNTSRMDVDEGAGRGTADVRQAKRILAMDSKP